MNEVEKYKKLIITVLFADKGHILECIFIFKYLGRCRKCKYMFEISRQMLLKGTKQQLDSL